MTVAKLELCRELYELSRWANNTKELDNLWGIDSDGKSAVITGQAYANGKEKIGIPITLIPAYDAGYLLRKLPKFRLLEPRIYEKVTGLTEYRLKLINHPKGWIAEYRDEVCLADTPEDALCSLAIELFKQNILTKDK